MGIPVLATLRAGIGEALNAAGAARGLAPLEWSYRASSSRGRFTVTGRVPEGVDEVTELVQAWAAALELETVTDAGAPGSVLHTGCQAGVTLVVWGVTDRATFEAPEPGASVGQGGGSWPPLHRPRRRKPR